MNLIEFSYRDSNAISRMTKMRDAGIGNLASGKRTDIQSKDSGAYSMATRINSLAKTDQHISKNLQNAVSFAQSQDYALESASKIIDRMAQLAGLATNSLISDSDRENYNKQFLSLSKQLNDLSTETFNGKKLFGSGTAGLDFITAATGLDYTNKVLSPATDPDTGSIGGGDVTGGANLNDAAAVPDVSGSPASNYTPITSGADSAAKSTLFNSMDTQWLKSSEDLIASEYGWTPDTSDGWNLIINETDANGSVAQVGSLIYSDGTADVVEMQMDLPDFSPPYVEADRIIAHEMVHVLHAQNTYYGDPTGDGSSSAKWLKEGLAEFIHGGDSRVYSELGENPTDQQIGNLINAIGTGNENWASSDQYAAAYLAVRFLHSEIKAAGHSDGIKHMTQWMKSQFDAGAGAADSGLNKYMSGFLSDRGYANNDEFLKVFKGLEDLEVIGDNSGSDLSLSSVSMTSIPDLNSYNLTTASKSQNTQDYLDTLTETLALERAKVGANSSRLKSQISMLDRKGLAETATISRIQSIDMADETTKVSTLNLKINFNLTAFTQAKNISRNLMGILFN